jgi:hypothetical protein
MLRSEKEKMMRDPEKDHVGQNISEADLIPEDSEDDVYEDRLMDARPSGVTIPPDDEEDSEE